MTNYSNSNCTYLINITITFEIPALNSSQRNIFDFEVNTSTKYDLPHGKNKQLHVPTHYATK